MPMVEVKFTSCIQDSQEYGSDEQHMVSRVFFSLSVDGQPHGECYADLKQVVGDDYETGEIEVSRPFYVGSDAGYKGPFSHDQFAKEAKAYFRGLVGSQGSGIRIEGGKGIRMMHNVFQVSKTVTFEARALADPW